jgi:hypothetical protein
LLIRWLSGPFRWLSFLLACAKLTQQCQLSHPPGLQRLSWTTNLSYKTFYGRNYFRIIIKIEHSSLSVTSIQVLYLHARLDPTTYGTPLSVQATSFAPKTVD